MWKRDPFLFSFWGYAWNVWFKKLRKLKLGSQQPCFLIPVLGCGDLGWDSNYGSQCGTHATSPIRVPPTLCRFLALSGPSLPLWDAFGLGPLNPEKQLETIHPHGLRAWTLEKERLSILSLSREGWATGYKSWATLSRARKRNHLLLFLRWPITEKTGLRSCCLATSTVENHHCKVAMSLS